MIRRNKEERKIDEVFDFKTGHYIDANKIFDITKDEAVLQRDLNSLRIKLEEVIQKVIPPIYGCPICQGYVKLRALDSETIIPHFYAIHHKECPLKEEKKISRNEILKYKYNGQQESDLHKNLKKFLADYLYLTPEVSDVVVEKVRKLSIKENSKSWKKPDLFAYYEKNNVKYPIAFEIQLSTTFLDVIVARNNFYKQDKSIILWIFSESGNTLRKRTTTDVFTTNNENIFVLSEEAMLKSRDKNELILLCIYKRYYKENHTILTEFKQEFVRMSDITFHLDDASAYFYDTKNEFLKLEIDIEVEKTKNEEKAKLLIENRTSKVRDLLNDFYKTDVKPRSLKSEINKLTQTERNYICEKLFDSSQKGKSSYLENIFKQKKHLNLSVLLVQNHFKNDILKRAIRDINTELFDNIFYSLDLSKIDDYNKVKKISNYILSIKVYDTNDFIETGLKNILAIFNNVFNFHLNYYYGYRYLFIRATRKYGRYSSLFKAKSFRNKIAQYKKNNEDELKNYNQIFFKLFPELDDETP